MNTEKTTSVETIGGKNETALTAPTAQDKNNFSPIFVEAEKMFERLADLTEITGHKAYEFFQKRGGEFGKEVEDWFKAESEILLPVPVEITESDEQFNVRAVVPGFRPEEIEISVRDNLLILSGKTEAHAKKENENTVLSEWRSNRFFRQLTLNSAVDPEKVVADLKDGILQLTLPKAPAREATLVAVNTA